MKHLQLFEKFQQEQQEQQEQQDKLIEFTLYNLIESSEDYTEEICGSRQCSWTDKSEAIIEARAHDTNFPDTDSDIILNIYIFKIPYTIFLETLGYDINDSDKFNMFELEELIDDFNINTQWIDLYHYYDIKSDHILSIDDQNKSTNEIIDEVITALNIKFRRSFRDYKMFSKYTDLYKDEDDNLTFSSDNGLDMDDIKFIEYEPITIRIADHTHNPRNGSNDLNVLIVNDDKTSNKFRFARTDLRYDGDSDIDEIVSDIINYWK